MAKVKVQDWDETASGNTDLNSISIAEGMAPSDVNNAQREEMSQIRKWNLYRGHISGLAVANDSDAAHDINFPVGECADSTNVQMLHVDTALVKQIDANWAAGTGAGGFPSGLTLSADTWYYLFVIGNVDGTVDAGFDTSATAANLLTDAGGSGYTLYRRVGSVLTDGSSNIIAFTATEIAGGGLLVEWTDPPLDLDSSAIGTSATTVALTTPTGYKTMARLNAITANAGGSVVATIRSAGNQDEAPSATAAPLGNLAAASGGVALAEGVEVLTDTSAQVFVRASIASTVVRIATLGWTDYRR